MEITVTIHVPDLANAILALAQALSQQAVPTPAKSETKPAAEPATTPVPAEDSPPCKDDKEPAQIITLEQVRAKLAGLSQGGKQAEVKKLIQKFGASKLTEIPADKYAEVMEAAEAI